MDLFKFFSIHEFIQTCLYLVDFMLLFVCLFVRVSFGNSGIVLLLLLFAVVVCCDQFRWKTSGDIYEGEWEQDVMHGLGTFFSGTGDVYHGQWENGLWHGKLSSGFVFIYLFSCCFSFSNFKLVGCFETTDVLHSFSFPVLFISF